MFPECPDDGLLVYVNMTESNWTQYQLSRIGAKSLVECVRKCYDQPHCFSLKYHEIEDPLSCQLTSFSTNVNCAHLTLVPAADIRHDSRTLITIECITCRTRGKPHKTHRCLNDVLFIVKELSDSANLDFLDEAIHANSVKNCAEKCFENCCQTAVYVPAEKKCRFTRKDITFSMRSACDANPLSAYVSQYNARDDIDKQKPEKPEEVLNIDEVPATVASGKGELASDKEGLTSTTGLPGTTLNERGELAKYTRSWLPLTMGEGRVTHPTLFLFILTHVFQCRNSDQCHSDR
ncbi:unnamed protein product [Gongylonema pulchrum]|uniref:Apple domain-containing protein n=1 Tax=Gongylonema pulchrum TaxID=637853 RepID=A0A183CUV3_9BILA|nr:unnamed protein product [Gongylonema pulchrum]